MHVTDFPHLEAMNWYLRAKYGKRSRNTNFVAYSLADATMKARLLADFYATGQGLYGPQCWREGQLTLVCELGDSHVIRHQIPEGWSVIEGGKKR